MFFCPKCDNMFSITKNPPVLQQFGGKNELLDTPTTPTTPTTVSDSSDIPKNTNNIDYNDIVNQILRNNNINLDDYNINIDNINKITKLDVYKKLTPQYKEIVYNRLMDFLSIEDKKKASFVVSTDQISSAYFICNNCAYFEPINNGTVVISKISHYESRDKIDHTDYKNISHIKTLPHTRNYICHNDKCESHSDHSKRDAVFYRLHGSYRVRYVCKQCFTSWI